MKTYWDTSAAINALVSPEVYTRLAKGHHVTRLHLLTEFFATMTGRGIEVLDADGNPSRLWLSAPECATWLREFSGRVAFEELNLDESLSLLDRAERQSVQGARIYDAWHAAVSSKSKADELLTRNTHHFADLCPKVAWP